MLTRNAARCNNGDDLANLGFFLKVSILSEAYLEPSRTSMIKVFAKIAESRELFCEKNSMIGARMSFNYGSAFTNTLPTSCLFKVQLYISSKYTLKIYLEKLIKKW